ncbi:unnamed protein product [Rotaria sordida]|uniref:PiggyBac transposable element-derived protein domain-containing protein n=1 Tax=Rotaria sordida TaxID=392033 RepID=A0A819V1I2_9BILA|nr:unnamed protein product [Rotaria sordida]CAF4103440.1 unnamed protein product [Rotaria sordida]
MPNKNKKTDPKNHTAIPNGMSETVDTSESEDEMKKIQDILKNQLVMNDTSRSSSLPPPNHSGLEPIDYFYFMFGKESFDILKEQSNLYSVQVNPNRPVNISESEIRQFVGILLMTGIYGLPQQRSYWTNSTRVESIASTMSRDRFLDIKKNLHVVDNTNQLGQNDSNYDRAFKIRPLLNIIKNNFRKIQKEEHLCVDEQIIPFKGKSIMKQHMPKKPNRWGYKMFLLADSISGICYDFIFYTGKTNERQYGFCTDIVLKLCEGIPKMMNYKLYFDNYFTTIQLEVQLKKLGIFSIGTIRSNRLTDINMKDIKSLQEEGRGSIDYRITQVDGVELCATCWCDNNIVTCLSTLSGCESIDMVKRWSASQKQHIQVKRPNVIKLYNAHMGGVDLLDMLVSFYRINNRSKKYYMKIIFHLIDLSVVNGWLLYRRDCSQFRLPKNEILSLLQFRVEIAEALMKSVVSKRSIRRGRPSLRLRSKENTPSPHPRAAPIRTPPASIRLDGFNHWPMSATKGRCRHHGCNIVFHSLKDKSLFLVF